MRVRLGEASFSTSLGDPDRETTSDPQNELTLRHTQRRRIGGATPRAPLRFSARPTRSALRHARLPRSDYDGIFLAVGALVFWPACDAGLADADVAVPEASAACLDTTSHREGVPRDLRGSATPGQRRGAAVALR